MTTDAQAIANIVGIRLRHTLRTGRQGHVTRIAWSPNGKLLGVPTQEGTVELWDPLTGILQSELRVRAGNWITTIAWSPNGEHIAAAAGDGITRIWSAISGERQSLPSGSTHLPGRMVTWSSAGLLALVSKGNCKVFRDDWSVREDYQFVKPIRGLAISNKGSFAVAAGNIFVFRYGSPVLRIDVRAGLQSLAWSPDDRVLAAGFTYGALNLFDSTSGRLISELEGHTRSVRSISFSSSGDLIASKSDDGSVRLWSLANSAMLVAIPEPALGGVAPANKKPGGIAFNPNAPVLATLGKYDRVVRIWDIDAPLLLGSSAFQPGLRYTTAKVVLVGDSGVGKTGLGWRISHGEFKEHSSTHGQQFWVVDKLRTTRDDKTECEAVLWDLAGQPDYRLTHALFLDNVDLALVLFDPGNHADPLKGVEYWLNALEGTKQRSCPTILVAARSDRASPTLTKDELDVFCQKHNISGGVIATSALKGDGIEELLRRIKGGIVWEDIATTVTTSTFKRIKEYVLRLKESVKQEILLAPNELHARLQELDSGWQFSIEEMMSAVQHLATHGYVSVLRGSSGSESILVSPEVLTNLASSFVLEARRNPNGLGALEESRVLRGEYAFHEIATLGERDREILLDATVALFLEHNICFRERLGTTTFLVFPSLINQKKPLAQEYTTVDDVAYTVSGRIENVYAALVVLLGYSNTFTRTNQWQNQAQYEMNPGEICGFRQVAEREGEIDLVLYYGSEAGEHVRSLFQGLFESFLLGREVRITKYPPVQCPSCGYRPDRAESVKRIRDRKPFLFCGECSNKITLPSPILQSPLAGQRSEEVGKNQEAARLRTQFELALTRIKGILRDRTATAAVPSCFISYAWGVKEHEKWVIRLAKDLENADVAILLDRKDNANIGSSIASFVERIAETQFVIVVGTPEYLIKYKNQSPQQGTFVAAEMDLLNQRLTGSKKAKASVLPILLADEEAKSLPPLLRGRVHADFQAEEDYFARLFDLIVALYDLPANDPIIFELRQSLSAEEL